MIAGKGWDMRAKLRALILVAMLVLPALPSAGAAAQDAPTRIFVHPIYGFSVEFDWSWEAIPLPPYFGSGGLSLASGQRRIDIQGVSVLSTDPQDCIEWYVEGIRAMSWVVSVADIHAGKVAELKQARPASAFAIYAVLQNDGVTETLIVECRFFERALGMALLVYRTFGTDIDADVGAARQVFDTTRSFDPWATDYAMSSSVLEGQLDTHLAEVNAYWSRVFADRGWGAYTPPADLIVFDSAFVGPCGPIDAGYNTHYCSGDTIIRVNRDMAIGDIQNNGVTALYAMVAHEVGHHVQNLRNVRFCENSPCARDSVPNPDYEYQVSCLVGAFVGGSDIPGIDDPMVLSTYTRSLIFMVEEEIHGDNTENVRWFMNGYLDGPEACFVFPLDD
jgi:predicted metalloprotease